MSRTSAQCGFNIKIVYKWHRNKMTGFLSNLKEIRKKNDMPRLIKELHLL